MDNNKLLLFVIILLVAFFALSNRPTGNVVVSYQDYAAYMGSPGMVDNYDDSAIPAESRSVDGQTYFSKESEITKLSAEVFALKRDYEVVNALIAELQQYNIQLKAGHKANLIKTTVRMAYITYQTIDSAKGTGKLYSEFLTEGAESGVELTGKVIKLARAVTPGESSIAINTKTLDGKVKDVALTGWVEAMASMGDPKEVAQEMLQGAGKINGFQKVHVRRKWTI